MERHFGWFATVAAEDLRRTCADGVERYRFAYNGRYEEQIRTYDLVARADGGSDLRVMVRDVASLTRVEIADPLAPWRGLVATRALDAVDHARLRAALGGSVFDGQPQRGLRLPSSGFYWTAAACLGGQFHYGAWLHNSPAFAALGFPAVLSALDPSGVPINQPRPDLGGAETPRSAVRFELTVGEHGLVPMPDAGRLFR